jgi:hypothetical protein
MKKLLMVPFLACLLFSGCANAPQITPETGVAIVRSTVGVGLTLVLNKNPKYTAAAGALAAGIDVAISKSQTLTIQGIDSYVVDVCLKNGVSQEDTALFTGLANTIYTIYVAQYKPSVIISSDPKVILYVMAFKDGVNDAVLVHGNARK